MAHAEREGNSWSSSTTLFFYVKFWQRIIKRCFSSLWAGPTESGPVPIGSSQRTCSCSSCWVISHQVFQSNFFFQILLKNSLHKLTNGRPRKPVICFIFCFCSSNFVSSLFWFWFWFGFVYWPPNRLIRRRFTWMLVRPRLPSSLEAQRWIFYFDSDQTPHNTRNWNGVIFFFFFFVFFFFPFLILLSFLNLFIWFPLMLGWSDSWVRDRIRHVVVFFLEFQPAQFEFWLEVRLFWLISWKPFYYIQFSLSIFLISSSVLEFLFFLFVKYRFC